MITLFQSLYYRKKSKIKTNKRGVRPSYLNLPLPITFSQIIHEKHVKEITLIYKISEAKYL